MNILKIFLVYLLTSIASAEKSVTDENDMVPRAPIGARVFIPNPDIYSIEDNEKNMEVFSEQDAQEIVKAIMDNPKLQQKVQAVLENDDTDSSQYGDWQSGCMGKGTKFPTIVLKRTKRTKPENSSNSNSSNIRINKFYGIKRDRFYVQNSGNGVMSFKFEPNGTSSEASIRGKDWKNEYIFAKGDIHWSMDNNYGGQHAVDGQPFALELQLIHYDKSYASLEDASKASDGTGILITSLNFEAAGIANPAIDPLSKASAAVSFPNKKWKQVHGPLDMKMLYPPDMRYYTYKGQYINEPCTSVTWIVFRDPGRVSYSQLRLFREMRDEASDPNFGIFLPPGVGIDSFDNQRAVNASSDDPTLLIVPEVELNAVGTSQSNSAFILIAGFCVTIINICTW